VRTALYVVAILALATVGEVTLRNTFALRKHTTKAGNVDHSMRTIQQFFTDSKDLGVMRAEALFTEFIVEHSLPQAYIYLVLAFLLTCRGLDFTVVVLHIVPRSRAILNILVS